MLVMQAFNSSGLIKARRSYKKAGAFWYPFFLLRKSLKKAQNPSYTNLENKKV